MADDAQSIRSLNWRELFPFINLFRAFRVAIHPSKLVLGFALLLLVYGGGRVLDVLWPASNYAVPEEVDAYTRFIWSHEKSLDFRDDIDKAREGIAGEYSNRLLALDKEGFIKLDDKSPEAVMNDAKVGKYRSDLEKAVIRERNKEFDAADKNLKDESKRLDDDKNLAEKDRRKGKTKLKEEHDERFRTIQTETAKRVHELAGITPRALFDSFFEYECRQFQNVYSSVLNNNWFTGIIDTSSGGTPAVEGNHQAPIGDPNVGVIRCVANMTVIGPGWLLRYHTIYFIIFAIWFLLMWAIFGGAIARIAAVHVARDEKISVRQALRFSTSKLLSFVFAPVIPLIIILGAGLLIGLGGLLLYIPVIGPIAVGALFILALLAGFIITLVGTGTVGGFNLMYSTIAVEGSDSFDAISRSFSYVFARPWRMIFYTVVSLIYGSLCFLFVRFFVYVMLAVTHFFTSWFLLSGTQPHRYWPEIWPPVSDQDMAYRINFQALSWSDGIGAFLIAMWVYIVLTLLAAFVVSFFFSSNTIIYYLMRREVDATELDDVYVEETDEDFAEPAVAAAPVTPAAPAPDAPPAAAPPA